MNDLLRLANELLEERHSGYRQKGWPCIERSHCPYTDDVCIVIQGYQELIRRMVDALDARDAGQPKATIGILPILDDARASIPDSQ